MSNVTGTHVVGSSRKITGGLLTSSRAIDRRFLSPPDRRSVLVLRHDISPSVQSTSSIWGTQQAERDWESSYKREKNLYCWPVLELIRNAVPVDAEVDIHDVNWNVTTLCEHISNNGTKFVVFAGTHPTKNDFLFMQNAATESDRYLKALLLNRL
jgi:hypothetical protein